ncbi:MAG TPA: VWA domain-containing protein [Dongiaceae bacterium]|nr:VWA domain-containing protein [Dongiaceae bacterium]
MKRSRPHASPEDRIDHRGLAIRTRRKSARRVAPLLLALLPAIALAQQDNTSAQASSTSADKSLPHTSSEEVLTFSKRVNLVMVPVVVRDKAGKAVGSLNKEDFQISDNGKPQTISSFNLEVNSPGAERNHRDSLLGNVPIENFLGTRPSHFFAYLFDDVHLQAGDLMQVRAAAKKHLASGMGPDDRAAIFTTSGDVSQEFTGDKVLLAESMDRIKPGFDSSGTKCPFMNYFVGKKIVEEFDGGSITPTWDAAADDAWNCLFNRSQHLYDRARDMTLAAARQALEGGHADTQRSLLKVQTMVRRLAAMPGARTLVLVSPGFQITDDHIEQNIAISLATERNIVINALDARGLYTGMPGADKGPGPSTLLAAQVEEPLNVAGLWSQTDVLAELAEGTGGKFFHDSNDLAAGLQQLGAPPEYVYVLGFRPEILKQGGRYHRLKVTVAKNHDLTVQARRGYYESAVAGDPEKMVSEEMEKALFSRDEMRTMPISLKAEFTKKDGSSRELYVTTHFDAGGIHFRKDNNTNVDELTVICALFDINGNYLQGKKQQISFHLEEDTLKQLTDGVNVKTKFDVEPGAYLIRVVLRDSGDELLSAVNGSGIVQ